MSKANPRYHRNNLNLPALSANQNVFRITAIGNVDGQLTINTMDYMNQVASVINTAAEQNLTNAWCTSVAAQYKAVCANDWSLKFVKATCLTNVSRAPFLNSTNAALGPGTGGANHLDIELAIVLSRYTPYKGQHARGRLYTPAIPTGFVTAGAGTSNQINNTGITAIGNLITALQATLSDGTGTYAYAVSQRTKGGSAVIYAALVSFQSYNAYLGTVRRRRIGRGK